jgi:hypothetical protein
MNAMEISMAPTAPAVTKPPKAHLPVPNSHIAGQVTPVHEMLRSSERYQRLWDGGSAFTPTPTTVEGSESPQNETADDNHELKGNINSKKYTRFTYFMRQVAQDNWVGLGGCRLLCRIP